MNELTDFQKATCAAGLKNMLITKNYFDICTLDSIAKTMGVKLGGPDYSALRNLHCMDWAEMGGELRDQVQAKCFELLGLPFPRVIEVPADKRAPDGKGLFSQLLGRIL